MNVTIQNNFLFVGDANGCIAVIPVSTLDRLISITTDAKSICLMTTDGEYTTIQLKSEQQARSVLMTMGTVISQWQSEHGAVTARAVRSGYDAAPSAGALTPTTLPGLSGEYKGIITPEWTAVVDMKPLTVVHEPMSLPVYAQGDPAREVTWRYCGDIQDILKDADYDQKLIKVSPPAIMIPFAMWYVTRSNGKSLRVCGPYSQDMVPEERPVHIAATASILAYFENFPLSEDHVRYCLQVPDFPIVGTFDDVESAMYLGCMKLIINGDVGIKKVL